MNEKKHGSGMAIASLIFGIAGLLLSCLVVGIFPAILSFALALRILIKGYPGKGMAIGGLVTSLIGIIIFAVIMIGVASNKEVKSGVKDGYNAALEQNSEAAESANKEPNAGITKQEETTVSETEEKTEFTIGDTVEVDNGIKMSIISAEVYNSDNQFIQPEDGKIYYKIDLEVENISEKDTTISSIIGFEAYEDGYSISQSYASGIENSLDGSLAAGKKIKGSLVYELSKSWEELEIQYKPNVWLDKKVIMKFENK